MSGFGIAFTLLYVYCLNQEQPDVATSSQAVSECAFVKERMNEAVGTGRGADRKGNKAVGRGKGRGRGRGRGRGTAFVPPSGVFSSAL